MELFVNRTTGNLTGWIGYTLSWTKRKFSELNAGKVFYPRYDRRNDISVVLAYKFSDSWNAGLTWTYATGQGYSIPTGQYQFQPVAIEGTPELQFNFTARNTYRLPSYHKLDLNVMYKFDWLSYNFEAYLNLFNVYNRQNPFAFYSSADNETAPDGSIRQITKFKQITLFPFVPSLGITMEF